MDTVFLQIIQSPGHGFNGLVDQTESKAIFHHSRIINQQATFADSFEGDISIRS